ncbi:Type II secretory pathway, component PulF / Type IV fimbrial assembly protein PilC [hydrothermal vent metagenome]|uniref:Type II secretory pathway, component PulF / Type IV fimbrial assembly protein PilC n=1 Tax=hydrothermal vent metagenome TaxID=652676 RepID=A0A3B0YFG1_9ZZZZ
MAAFEYKAVDHFGKTVLGRIEASNDDDLELRLTRMGLDLVNFRTARNNTFFSGRGRVDRPELVTFCFHLEQLTRAGVAILDALADLRDSVPNPRFRDVLSAIIEDIEGGKNLSGALAGFPHVFDPVFVNLIAAGEQSGKLPEILRELTESLKWQDELAAHTKKIIMYPAFVGVVILGVMAFMMIYLVPQLVGFITSMGAEIPIHTKALIFVSDIVSRFWYLFLVTPPLLFYSVRYWARHSSAGRYKVDLWKLNAPAIGTIYKKIILSRFTSNFALLYKAGISVLDCIRMGETLVANAVIAEALQRVRRQISEGVALTASFENTGLFPPLVVRMFRVGESSGALDRSLENVSYFFNRDVRESIERVQALIEPVLTVILGAMLGWVMLSVLGPVYDMLGKITR